MKFYAYRVFPPDRIEDRLNEAQERGWSLHTFTDANDESWATAVFKWVGTMTEYQPPFADDDEEAE